MSGPNVNIDLRGQIAQTSGVQMLGARVITAGPVTISDSDFTLVVNQTVAGPLSIPLPAASGLSTEPGSVRLRIFDGKGDAASNNITIAGTGALIDGLASVVIATNWGGIDIEWCGTYWHVLSQSGSTSGGATDVQEFTTPGAFNYTTPSGAYQWLDIEIWGGGGGGGAGARYAAAASGGGGGGGGGYTKVTIPFSSADPSYTGTIGSGGAGGAAVAVNSTDGNPGTDGTLTLVTGLYGAAAGTGGEGGTATTADGGDGGSGTQGGGSGGGASTGVGDEAPLSLGPAGGGGGGGWDGATASNGGDGGKVVPYLTLGGLPGAAPSGAGGDGNTSTGLSGTGGGGGGASAGVAAAGAGGDGGDVGAGGGGGGGTNNGQNSGAGGAGANGRARFTAR